MLNAKQVLCFVRFRVFPISAALLLAGYSPAHAANLILNGNFHLPGAGCQAGTTVLPDWTVVSGNVDIEDATCTGGLPPKNGTYYLDLTGSFAVGASDVGVISQTITTVVGQQYALTFAFGGNPQWQEFTTYPNDSEYKAMAVFVNGAISGVFGVHTAGVAVTNAQWTTKKIPFTATSASTTVTFQSLNGSATNPSNFGPLLDGVSVVPVTTAGYTCPRSPVTATTTLSDPLYYTWSLNYVGSPGYPNGTECTVTGTLSTNGPLTTAWFQVYFPSGWVIGTNANNEDPFIMFCSVLAQQSSGVGCATVGDTTDYVFDVFTDSNMDVLTDCYGNTASGMTTQLVNPCGAVATPYNFVYVRVRAVTTNASNTPFSIVFYD